MKKLTKAQKASYPEFIVYIDYSAAGVRKTGVQIFTKAMEETNILDAMRRAETVIQERAEDIYLVDIYAKTGEETEIGEPIYKTAIMTRVHTEYGKACSSQWHFRDEAHSESEDGKYLWYGNEDRKGVLEFYSK